MCWSHQPIALIINTHFTPCMTGSTIAVQSIFNPYLRDLVYE